MSKDTFCAYPWLHLHNFPDGRVAPCCDYKGAIQKNTSPNNKEVKTPFFIQSDSVNNIYSSEYLLELRENLGNNIRVKECQVCWKKEDRGQESKRQVKLKHLKEAGEVVDTDKIPFLPLEMQIVLNNSCNLKCRMCGPKYSSSWRKEIKEYSSRELEILAKDEYTLPHKQPGRADGVFLNDVENWGKDLTSLEVIGGEPFYSTSWIKVFNKLIDYGYSKNIELIYTTNGTIVDKQLIEFLITKFKKVTIGVSVDGMGPVFEYIRSGGIWTDLERNLPILYELKVKYPGKFTMSIVYSYNWLNIIQLPEFCNKVLTKFPGILLHLNSITYPLEWSLQCTPLVFSKQIIEKLENALEFNSLPKNLREEVRAVINILRNLKEPEVTNTVLYNRLFILDSKRNTDLIEVLTHIENNHISEKNQFVEYSVAREFEIIYNEFRTISTHE